MQLVKSVHLGLARGRPLRFTLSWLKTGRNCYPRSRTQERCEEKSPGDKLSLLALAVRCKDLFWGLIIGCSEAGQYSCRIRTVSVSRLPGD